MSSTHKSLTSVEHAQGNGVIMICLQCHIPHKMQPLDRTIYGPLKTSYNTLCDKCTCRPTNITMWFEFIVWISRRPNSYCATRLSQALQPVADYNPDVFSTRCHRRRLLVGWLSRFLTAHQHHLCYLVPLLWQNRTMFGAWKQGHSVSLRYSKPCRVVIHGLNIHPTSQPAN